MSGTDLTDKDRSFAAAAGVSGTPFSTPPATPSRRSSSGETTSKESPILPRSALYIIFVEGCERFCFYGLKTILLLYFTHFLLLGKDSATAGYHLFSFGCYFTPTIGAIISDGFFGRYWTILFLSIFYFVGTVVLTLTAIPQIGRQHLLGPIIGLGLIALGTGGIKPCVSAFGADQISTSNSKQLSRYFAFFYFAINSGSLISTIVTPLIRSRVHCFGYDCYSLAFGIPSLLVLIAIVIFILGTSLYKRVPPKENVIVKFILIIARAIRNTIFRSSYVPKLHWIYNADDKYNNEDIKDVHSVLRVCMLFTPIPVYFALYNQSGSRWTYQASLMNGNLGPFGTIEPDQIQALNSIFVLIFIPLFEEIIYPALARFNLLIRPLQRMFCGMIIMIFAFLMAAILQEAIQTRIENVPNRLETRIFNGYDCPLNLSTKQILDVDQTLSISCAALSRNNLTLRANCGNQQIQYELSAGQQCPTGLIVTGDNQANPITIITLITPSVLKRQENGLALLRLISLDGIETKIKTVPNEYVFEIEKNFKPTEYKIVLPNKYRLENMTDGQKTARNIDISSTGAYTVLLYQTNKNKLNTVLFEDVPSGTVHMIWQLFQYVLLTTSEILVSITGLIFAYSQAPRRFKSVIMSAWLMTTAIGDLLVVFIAKFQLVEDQAWEFVLFAGLMAFATFIFGILAINYKEEKHINSYSEDQHLILDPTSSEVDDTMVLTH